MYVMVTYLGKQVVFFWKQQKGVDRGKTPRQWLWVDADDTRINDHVKQNWLIIFLAKWWSYDIFYNM